MDPQLVEKIEASPSYQQLVSRRSRFGWTLTFVVMLVYYGFILLVAFRRELLSRPLGEGVTTWGMPIGLAVILLTVVLTGVYVRRANREFDSLTEQVRREVL